MPTITSSKNTTSNNIKNLTRLFFGQVFAYIHAPSLVFATPIIAYKLAPSTSLASLPIALLALALVGSIPLINRFMREYGRRLGYMLGALLVMISAMGCYFSIIYNSFIGFCISVAISGVSGAFVQSYRFAVIELSSKERSGRNVSLLLLGGVAGGFSGPLIVNYFVNDIENYPFAASFLALAGVGFISLLVLSGLQLNQNLTEVNKNNQTGLKPFKASRSFIACAICGAGAYGLMSLLMTATPVVMHYKNNFSLSSVAFVIQSHVVAMFLPSLFTGILIDKIGSRIVLYFGIVILLFSSIAALTGVLMINFWIALVLLGIGWNFLFVGATITVSKTYSHHHRFKAQSTNDLIVFSVQALGALSSAWLINLMGWSLMQYLTTGVLLLLVPLIYFTKTKLNKQLN